jgi:sugar-specific transcriptional regulator TrmB
MERNEILEALRKFGLSAYEASAYTALVLLGPSKAGAVCKEAGVPQSKIYEVLDQLIDKQLVEFVGGRPKEFRALPPSVGLKNLIEDREKALEELKSRLSILDGSFKALASEEVIDGVWSAKERGLRDFIEKLSDMYDRTKKYAYLITRDFTWHPRLVDSVKACIKRGVKIKTVTMREIDEDNYHRAKYFQKCGVMIKFFKTDVHPRIIVVDGREVLIRLDQNPKKTRNFQFTSLYSADPSLVTVFDGYMKNLWRTAKPVNFEGIAKKLKS